MIKAVPYSFFGSLAILLFLTWISMKALYRSRMERYKEIIADLERDARKQQQTPEQSEPLDDPFKKPHWDIVNGHTFTNQIVELDGKSFRNCSFTNVTLSYDGKAPTEILTGCIFGPSVVFDTRNPALIEYWRLQKFIRSFPGAQVQREGAADAKGNLIPDNFSFEAIPSENVTALDLCSRVLILSKALQTFLKDHGPTPRVERDLGKETTESFQERWRASAMPWRTKFHGDYRIRFGKSVPIIRDEIKARHGISDSILNAYIDRAETNPNGDIEAVEKISMMLWNMARLVDDGT